MQHKFKLAILSSMLCANAYATPIYQPPGPNLTYGSSSNNQSIMSSIANPAAAAAVLRKEDSQYRFGIIHIGGGYEIGNVNSLADQIDKSKNTIVTPVPATTVAILYAQDCPTGTCSPAQQATFATNVAAAITAANGPLISQINNEILPALQKDGNASLFFGGHVPLTPFVIARKGWGGSIVLDANVSAIVNGSFLADPLDIPAIAGAVAGSYNPVTQTYSSAAIPNDSTLLLKGAVITELGLGYSRAVFRKEAPEPTEEELAAGKMTSKELRAGELTAGVRLKYYQVKLADKAARLAATTGDAQSTFNSDLTYSSNSGLGLDVGTLWTSKNYRAGAWINNLNSPSFKYNTIDTTGYTSTAVISQLNTGMTYTMKPQLQLEGAVFSKSQNFVANVGLDANPVKDPVGREFQWMTLSGAYATNSWWIPGARLGYRTNLAGSKLSYVTGGLTLFKALSLDIAYSLDSIHDNKGNSIPRSFMANFGIQMTF